MQPLGDLKIEPLDDDEDWQNAWKSHFNLLKLGKRLVIKPSWIEYQPAPNDLVIDLDPGLAFGTGYHPTTYGCLEALEQLVHTGAEVLDLGTGSGILTIAAVKLGAATVLSLDTDPIAVRAATKNFRKRRARQGRRTVWRHRKPRKPGPACHAGHGGWRGARQGVAQPRRIFSRPAAI